MCLYIVRCATGSIRLVGGSEQYEGRLEVCIDEVWGTICDDAFDSMDAGVACAQLGYSRFSKFLCHYIFKQSRYMGLLYSSKYGMCNF